MALTILEHLGVTAAGAVGSINEMLAPYPNGRLILAQEQAGRRVWMDAWLTETGHKRPGMKRGLPMVIDPLTGGARLLTNSAPSAPSAP